MDFSIPGRKKVDNYKGISKSSWTCSAAKDDTWYSFLLPGAVVFLSSESVL
jgi:hypothetical protein